MERGGYPGTTAYPSRKRTGVGDSGPESGIRRGGHGSSRGLVGGADPAATGRRVRRVGAGFQGADPNRRRIRSDHNGTGNEGAKRRRFLTATLGRRGRSEGAGYGIE